MTGRADPLWAKVLTDSAQAGAAGALLSGGDPKTTALATGAASLKTIVGAASTQLSSFLRDTPTARLQAVEAEIKETLKSLEPQLLTRFERILEAAEDDDAVVTNSTVILEGWRRLWVTCGDDKKRRLITAALVNAFDVDAYEEGLTLTLFSLLEKLDYGDLHLLATHGTQTRGSSHTTSGAQSWSPGSLGAFHMARLIDAQLMLVLEQHQRRSFLDTKREVTTLGQRMKRLLQNPQAHP